jgi:hypothetical protein
MVRNVEKHDYNLSSYKNRNESLRDLCDDNLLFSFFKENLDNDGTVPSGDILFGLVAQEDTSFMLQIGNECICKFNLKKGDFVHPLFNKSPIILLYLAFHQVKLVSFNDKPAPVILLMCHLDTIIRNVLFKEYKYSLTEDYNKVFFTASGMGALGEKKLIKPDNCLEIPDMTKLRSS